MEHSIEFFPAKTEAGAEKLRHVAQQLSELKPAFVSVTYGAGGTTRERTLGAVKDMQAIGFSVAPHLTCVGASKAKTIELLDGYRADGINRIVALRGDLPQDATEHSRELTYAADLIRLIREHSGDHFHLEVAAYPEGHPQASSYDDDIAHFVEKARAGANSALTQYFFNPDAYFHFVERVRAHGCDIDIIPGIMPITHFANLVRFSDACGAEIPRWIRQQIASYGEDSASIEAFSEEMVTRLCQQLLAGGAPGLHFYSMNQAEATTRLWRNLGL